MHEGHRNRLYEKLKKDALEDHEWLEALLFNALPRKNTNDLAHALIKKFGSSYEVVNASVEELQTVPGIGISIAAYLHNIGRLLQKHRQKNEMTYQGRFTPRDFLPFVKQAYKDTIYEVLELYLLDGDGRVIKKQGFSIESIAHVSIVPEELSGFLLEKGASGVVMVHNHPYGKAMPSDADDETTRNCQMLCSMHNRLLCEHVICAQDGIFSYYLSGRLQEISKRYSASALKE
ncbi:MAG: RadC family protein [Clostridia bacterium]|nr:RadC family protein [Clostridia bacterium]